MSQKFNKHALISIIIPTYNRASYITRAINSLINQYYEDLEIIVVDDGSTDETEKLIATAYKHRTNLIYVKKINGGCASAINTGLVIANGYYMSFLGSDDMWLPTASTTLTSVLRETAAEFVYSPSIEVFPNGKQKINYPVAADEPEKLAKAHFLETNIRSGSFLWTRSALQKVGLLDESLRYNEDSDFLQRMALCCRAAYSPTPTVMVYHHPNEKSSNRVEIYKALLISSENILAKNPDFAGTLGLDAVIRIQKIKRHLLEALVLHGEFEQAKLISNEINHTLGPGAKISLLINSIVLMRIDLFFQKCLSYLKRALYSRLLVRRI